MAKRDEVPQSANELTGLVMAAVAAAPHGRASYKTLLRDLGLKGESRRSLESALDTLAAKGSLIALRGQQYVLPRFTHEFAVGRLNMHRDGYGFVIPDEPPLGLRGDLFLPPDSQGDAMHGDRVLARILRVQPDGRGEGEVIRVLRRAHPTVVGEFRAGRRKNYVVPRESRIQHHILIPEGLEIPEQHVNPDRIGARQYAPESPEDLDGLIVNVELLEFPEKGDAPIGRVVEILGYPDDFGVDVEITIRKHHLPHKFAPEVLEQAQSIPAVIRAEEVVRRTDFRDLDIVTIDGETARDFDDAVWVERLPGGGFALQVHIADVSHYVQPGSPIDRAALERGTSVYFPDRAVPMLPLELSTEICSLKPQVDRLVMSALLEIDNKGDTVGQKFVRGIIRSSERMTYTDVHALLEGDVALQQRYEKLVLRFELMQELALLLNRNRVRRGSIDFDLPEPLLVFDEEGEMKGIARSPRNIAHRIIEEFMLAANEAVASHLENAGIESVYRIHEVPDPQRVLDFEEIAVRFGYTLGFGAMPVKKFHYTDKHRDGRKTQRTMSRPDERFTISSRHYQKLVAKLEGKPEERILSYLMLRSLKQARYSTRNHGHFALAAPSYTHFTSPIRRYPDLLVHRLLGALLDHESAEIPGLSVMTEMCSDTERRAAEAERELLEWKKVRFMSERVGEDFSALIISTTRYGFFVELDELFVEGLVPMDILPGDRYAYHENSRQVIGERSRRAFSIGDKVTVQLDRVDSVDMKLFFSLVEPEKRHRGAGVKGRRRPS